MVDECTLNPWSSFDSLFLFLKFSSIVCLIVGTKPLDLNPHSRWHSGRLGASNPPNPSKVNKPFHPPRVVTFAWSSLTPSFRLSSSPRYATFRPVRAASVLLCRGCESSYIYTAKLREQVISPLRSRSRSLMAMAAPPPAFRLRPSPAYGAFRFFPPRT